MTNAEAKLEIFKFYSSLKTNVVERQYSFILNISAIAAGAIVFLFKEVLIGGNALVGYAFLALFLSLVISILLMFFSTEFDTRYLKKEESWAKDVLEGKRVGNYKDGGVVGNILNIMYYFSFLSFLIGMILIGISTISLFSFKIF